MLNAAYSSMSSIAQWYMVNGQMLLTPIIPQKSHLLSPMMHFFLLFSAGYAIRLVLGGVPDNARVMGCTCANSPSLPAFFFVYYSE